MNEESARVQTLSSHLDLPLVHQHFILFPVNLLQISVEVPSYDEQGAVESMQPVPFVKHPL